MTDALTTEDGMARLDRWIAANVEGHGGPVRITRFNGGQSNPTYRIDSTTGIYVLRSKPPGDLLPTAHAVDREFRVLRALAGTDVPTPRALVLCEDEAVIGRVFYLMEHVEGRVAYDPRLPGVAPADRAAIFDAMNATIATLHAIDPADVGLEDYGRSGAYMARQVARWTKQYRASRTDPNPAMERLIEWLPAHLPAERATRVIHGDFRLDNIVLHPTEPRVVAVLDWELSTLGDPMADFAYHCLSWRVEPELFRGLRGVDLAALGIPSEEAYLAAYLDRTGLAAPENWEYYLAFSLFRIAAIIQGIAMRAETGSAADARAAETGALARPLAERAWELAETAA